MTKGRQYLPSSANEGNWFRHRGEPEDTKGGVHDVTSTRAMCETPFSAPANPRSPPGLYKQREKSFYRTSNPFSNHDNRHIIQGQGEYMGNGYDTRYFGRRLHPIDRRMHHTDVAFLHHSKPNQYHYSPTTATTYRDPGLIEPLSHRRFPKIYHNAESSQSMTGTIDQSNSPHRTPLRVLAMSQQPFLRPNNWKYSFHGDYRVYPPYDRKRFPSPVSSTDLV